MFADISPRYDLLNHVLSLNVDRRWRRLVVRRLELQPDSEVLDVCTGTGDLALELAAELGAGKASESTARTQPTGRVVGTDFTPEMVRLAEAKRRRLPHSRTAFAVADTLALPFGDGSFDVVTVAFGIRNVADLDAGLAEMLRVLKPGGRAAILEFSQPRIPGFRAIFRAYFHHVLPRLGGWISGSRKGRKAYAYLPASVAEFPSAPELSKRLQAVGFSTVSVLTLSLGIAAIHIATRPPGKATPGTEKEGP